MPDIRFLTADDMARECADDIEARRAIRIEWSRLDDPMKAIRWLLHLAEKAGFTVIHAEIFLFIVCEKFGWEPHGL